MAQLCYRINGGNMCLMIHLSTAAGSYGANGEAKASVLITIYA
jgi:hypothetical protein